MPRKKPAAGIRVAPEAVIKPEAAKELDAFLDHHIERAIQRRDEILPRVQKWRRTVEGRRMAAPVRRGASNLSVPLLVWARTAVRARLTESVLESRPLISVEPLPGRIDGSDMSNTTIANSLGRFLTSEILNKRGLDGRIAIEKAASEIVDIGSSALKVIVTPDTVRKIGPTAANPDAKPREITVPGRVMWKHVSYLDLLYFDGYGTDVNAMPFIGHQFPMSYQRMEMLAKLGHYDTEAVAAVKDACNDDDDNSGRPCGLRMHDAAEIYIDWDIDGDGIQESLLIDYHVKAKRRLRTIWNPFPDGRRPLVILQFDMPADPNAVRGHGVSEKLEGPQDEADAVHNIAIEAGKRGAAHVVVIKENTRAEEEFGGGEEMLPGDVVVTGNAQEDINAVPLGDAIAAQHTIALEEHTRLYVTRILGLDEARIGNVESGKRVAASVGMATMREGRMITKAALTSIGEGLGELAYLTLDLYKQYIPERALLSSLSPQEASALMSAVFTVSDASLRGSYLIRVNAQDASIAQEIRQQESMLLTQALLPFYDRMSNMIMAITNPQLPPTAKKPLMLLVERMERSLEVLLNSVESIKNPNDLLVRVGELNRLLGEAAPDATTPDGTVDESLIGPLGQDDEEGLDV